MQLFVESQQSLGPLTVTRYDTTNAAVNSTYGVLGSFPDPYVTRTP